MKIISRIISIVFLGKKVICVFGMRRSGNHALINWILSSYVGEPARFSSKIKNSVIKSSTNKKAVLLNSVESISGLFYLKTLLRNILLIRLSKIIIISCEDIPPSFMENIRIPRNSKKIFVKRSLLNLVSSRVFLLQNKSFDGRGCFGMNVDQPFFNCLQEWEKVNQSILIWNYDKWLQSREFRREFLDRLGLVRDVMPPMSEEGDGSSFSRQNQPDDLYAFTRRHEKLKCSGHLLKILNEPNNLKMFSQEEQAIIKTIIPSN